MTPRFLPFDFAIFLGSYDANQPTDLYYLPYVNQNLPNLCARSDYIDVTATYAYSYQSIENPELQEAQKRFQFFLQAQVL